MTGYDALSEIGTLRDKGWLIDATWRPAHMGDSVLVVAYAPDGSGQRTGRGATLGDAVEDLLARVREVVA